jgi:hypothetical protein
MFISFQFSLCRDRLTEGFIEIQSKTSLVWKVIVVWELGENCHGRRTGKIKAPRGTGTSDAGNRYQRIDNYIAD